MAKKNKKQKVVTNLDVIQSIRKPPVKGGQTFKVKKGLLHRKRKHKGKTEE